MKKTAKEFAAEPDGLSRFQRFLSGGEKFSPNDRQKFADLESELQTLKNQMAMLLQGQISISPKNESPSVPIPPPCPSQPSMTSIVPASHPSDVRSIPISASSSLSLLNELICSGIAHEHWFFLADSL